MYIYIYDYMIDYKNMLPPKKIDKCFHDGADDISSHDIFSFPTFISILRLLYYILGWEM